MYSRDASPDGETTLRGPTTEEACLAWSPWFPDMKLDLAAFLTLNATPTLSDASTPALSSTTGLTPALSTTLTPAPITSLTPALGTRWVSGTVADKGGDL